jgi:hypothetical protein
MKYLISAAIAALFAAVTFTAAARIPASADGAGAITQVAEKKALKKARKAKAAKKAKARKDEKSSETPAAPK